MTEHSILPPSSAARRVACPGSRGLEALYPDDDSPHAREGHAAHWVASEALSYSSRLRQLKIDVGTIAPNGELVTQEMIEGAQEYVQAILKITGLNGFTEKRLHIEKRVSIAVIHPDCWGTPDCWAYVNDTIHIWDYKYGHGTIEIFENWQIIEYAAGILDSLRMLRNDDSDFPIVLHLVQPRGFHRDGIVRTWRTTRNNLQPYFEKLRQAEIESLLPNARTAVSPECTYCRGRSACETLQRAAVSAADITGQNVPFDLTPVQTGAELRYLLHASKLLQARVTGLTEQATSMIRTGKTVPHFALEASAGRQDWTIPPSKVAALGELYDKPLAKEIKTVTPKQALKAGIPENIINKFSKTQHGAMKLVADTKQPRKIFGENK